MAGRRRAPPGCSEAVVTECYRAPPACRRFGIVEARSGPGGLGSASPCGLTNVAEIYGVEEEGRGGGGGHCRRGPAPLDPVTGPPDPARKAPNRLWFHGRQQQRKVEEGEKKAPPPPSLLLRGFGRPAPAAVRRRSWGGRSGGGEGRSRPSCPGCRYGQLD